MPGLSQTQIAEELHKDKTTITRMINTLIKKDKLMRKSSLEDKRVFKIYVTEKTKENVKKLTPVFEKQKKDLEDIIGESDYNTTIKVLEKIKKYYLELNK
jgi:DNA-binding MarR family transcriptional regulator